LAKGVSVSAAFDHFGLPISTPPTLDAEPVPESPVAKKPVGHTVAVITTVVTVVAAGVLGFTLFSALDVIHVVRLSKTLADASGLLAVTLVMSLLLFATLLVHIVCLFRVRPRMIPTLGLVINLLLPPLAAVIGAKIGVDLFSIHLSTEALVPGADLVESFRKSIEGAGADSGWVEGLVTALLSVLG
jgi:p-aminobenzoyl-glutamate transporter AbgT